MGETARSRRETARRRRVWEGRGARLQRGTTRKGPAEGSAGRCSETSSSSQGGWSQRQGRRCTRRPRRQGRGQVGCLWQSWCSPASGACDATQEAPHGRSCTAQEEGKPKGGEGSGLG